MTVRDPVGKERLQRTERHAKVCFKNNAVSVLNGHVGDIHTDLIVLRGINSYTDYLYSIIACSPG